MRLRAPPPNSVSKFLYRLRKRRRSRDGNPRRNAAAARLSLTSLAVPLFLLNPLMIWLSDRLIGFDNPIG